MGMTRAFKSAAGKRRPMCYAIPSGKPDKFNPVVEKSVSPEHKESSDIGEMKMDRLKALAKEKGIPFTGLKKAELIEALKGSGDEQE